MNHPVRAKGRKAGRQAEVGIEQPQVTLLLLQQQTSPVQETPGVVGQCSLTEALRQHPLPHLGPRSHWQAGRLMA